jgi:hypothetical protein
MMEDPEALPERGRQHARSGRGRHQRERAQRVLEGSGVETAIDDEVDRKVLHRRIEQLLHGSGQPVHLVDEEDVVLGEVGENAHEVRAALDGRPRGGHQIGPHLVGQDAGQRRLAQAGRSVEQHVIHAFAPLARGLDRDAQAGHRLLLADVLLERAGPELALELRLLGCRHPAEHPPLVGRGRGHEALAPR